MFRTVFLTLVTLAIAIGGGAASVWYTLRAQEGIGAVTIGNWTAYPNMGALDADPYSKARAAREGMLALGRAEGLAFFSNRDSGGDTLSRKCTYVDRRRHAAGPVLDAVCGRPVARHACRRRPAQAGRELARRCCAIPTIPSRSQSAPARRPATGSAFPADGPMVFVLTFYDTPVSSSAGIAEIDLPQVLRTGCHA